MTKKTGTYVVEQKNGDGLDLSGGGIRKTIGFVVKFDLDGEIAWRGPVYFVSSTLKTGPMKSAATKAAKRWQAYYDRTGSRFEVEQKVKREQDAATKKADRAVRLAKMNAGVTTYEALARLVREIDRGGHGDAALKQAREALLKAEAA